MPTGGAVVDSISIRLVLRSAWPGDPGRLHVPDSSICIVCMGGRSFQFPGSMHSCGLCTV